MKFFLGLILGIVIGGAAVWYYQDHGHRLPVGGTVERTDSDTSSAANTSGDRLSSLKLRGDDIKEELARTGRVIREKAQEAGRKISDATADARATAAIKAKLVRDPDLSAWDIHVSTTGGVVTLSGDVTSPGQVGKAMLLAMDTDGVRQVVSTLQVKTK